MLPCFCKVDGCEDKHSTFLHPPAVRAPNGTQSDIGTQSAYVNVDKLQCAFSEVGGSVTGLPVVPVKVRATLLYTHMPSWIVALTHPSAVNS